MTVYPPAEQINNGHSAGDIDFTYANRIVLHTTETKTLPSYAGGGTAPHLTYNPISRVWFQHLDLNLASRSLVNLEGGVQTNRAGHCLQVEIICYSAKSIADSVGGLWVANLSDNAIDDLRAFLDWACEEYDIDRTRWPNKQAFSSAEANAPGFRMSHSEWTAFDGICAHQHVPENTHWDTGAISWDKLMEEPMPTVEEIVAAVVPAVREELESNPVRSRKVDAPIALSADEGNGAFVRDQIWKKNPSGPVEEGAMRTILRSIDNRTVNLVSFMDATETILAEILEAVQAIDNSDNTALIEKIDTANAHLVAIRTGLGAAGL